ncbi:hypothetical protein, partial [Paramuribaculum intestinale]|uniref:hypothetical protein n=1 Tax=Paramuribaculum intestinale TaxID=2094151 RepID=UPI0025A9B82C
KFVGLFRTIFCTSFLNLHRAQQLGMMQAGVVARQACLRPYSSPYTQANAPLTDKKWQNSKKMANFAAGMP